MLYNKTMKPQFRIRMSPTELTGFIKRIKIVNECHIWQGGLTTNGYGVKRVAGVQIGAHRAAYQHWIGVIPENMEVHHKCLTKTCVNPKHLELVQHGHHMQIHTKLRTHCKNGHELNDTNTRIIKYKSYLYRQCKMCYPNKTLAIPGVQCHKGHPLIGENLVQNGKHKICRICRNSRMKIYQRVKL